MPKGAHELFVHGDLFEYRFETVAGEVGFLAEVEIEGTTLHLRDIAVYPTGPSQALAVGAAEVLRCFSLLEDLARDEGFDDLRITGQRLSGANPGATVSLDRSLK